METDKITHAIIGCAMKVHSELGTGFQETIYQRALRIEFNNAGLSYKRELEMPINYKGAVLGKRRVDFFVENLIMVELKAISDLLPVHKTQAINFLEAYQVRDGLLINFGSTKLQYHRVFNNRLVDKNYSWISSVKSTPPLDD